MKKANTKRTVTVKARTAVAQKQALAVQVMDDILTARDVFYTLEPVLTELRAIGRALELMVAHETAISEEDDRRALHFVARQIDAHVDEIEVGVGTGRRVIEAVMQSTKVGRPD